jgi:pimeloyl-ACP methyl ester carboxylesterase
MIRHTILLFSGRRDHLLANLVEALAGRETDAPAADLFRQQKKVDGIAWKSKPSWFIVAKDDRTVHPDLQRFVAKRMGATIVETKSSHVIMLSQPDLVIDVIRKAAAAVQQS